MIRWCRWNDSLLPLSVADHAPKFAMWSTFLSAGSKRNSLMSLKYNWFTDVTGCYSIFVAAQYMIHWCRWTSSDSLDGSCRFSSVLQKPNTQYDSVCIAGHRCKTTGASSSAVPTTTWGNRRTRRFIFDFWFLIFDFPVSSDNLGNMNQSTDRLEFSARNNTEGLQMNQPIEFENTLKCFVRMSKRAAVFDMYARWWFVYCRGNVRACQI